MRTYLYRWLHIITQREMVVGISSRRTIGKWRCECCIQTLGRVEVQTECRKIRAERQRVEIGIGHANDS